VYSASQHFLGSSKAALEATKIARAAEVEKVF
jgi:hypothetical protein